MKAHEQAIRDPAAVLDFVAESLRDPAPAGAHSV
jgi:hypothetical protein